VYNIIIEKGCDFLVGTYSAAREQRISILLYGFTYYHRTRNGITFVFYGFVVYTHKYTYFSGRDRDPDQWRNR